MQAGDEQEGWIAGINTVTLKGYKLVVVAHRTVRDSTCKQAVFDPFERPKLASCCTSVMLPNKYLLLNKKKSLNANSLALGTD